MKSPFFEESNQRRSSTSTNTTDYNIAPTTNANGSPADMVWRLLRRCLRRVQNPLDRIHHRLRFRIASNRPIQQPCHAISLDDEIAQQRGVDWSQNSNVSNSITNNQLQLSIYWGT